MKLWREDDDDEGRSRRAQTKEALSQVARQIVSSSACDWS